MAADLGVGALIAPENGLSYVRGTTDVPLSEATIGRFLLDTAGRFPDRPAVVFREQRVRWTWREFANEVDVLAAGRARHREGRSRRHLVAEPQRMAAHAVRDRADRRGARQHQSGLPAVGLEYALNKVGCKAVIAAERFKTSAYVEMLQTIAPEPRPRRRAISMQRACRACARSCRWATSRQPACSASRT